MTPDLRAAAQALVERTAVGRGLPAAIKDPAVLARVAALVGPRPSAAARRRVA